MVIQAFKEIHPREIYIDYQENLSYYGVFPWPLPKSLSG